MKTPKSPESAEVTPSKKKLKQARLPFKIISEVSPKAATPPSRKRKLSTPEDASATKVGKISTENGIAEDPVILIDDDSKDAKSPEKTDKLPNPYVKLVDNARKKKQKSKRTKKGKLSKAKENAATETGSETANGRTDHCEVMEVDEPEEIQPVTNGADPEINDSTLQNETENTVNKYSKDVSDIVVLEDSNNVSDNTQTEISEVPNPDVEEEENANISDKSSTETEIKENGATESPEASDSEPKDSEKEESLKAPVTPKRSTRNKVKQEENNNSKGSPSSSKMNASITSSPSTPKQGKSNSTAKLDESSSGSTPSNNLTPKQLQKKLESAKKREEREKEKQDREMKRLQEKEERAKQKQEKEDQRKREREEKEEAKKKEREEKEELKRKEKEEKEKLKEQEKKQREEKEEQKRKEKEEKEEQKRKEKEAREEERRKKQEALELEKQELEQKKKKEAEAFVSFFVPKQKSEKDQTVGTVSNNMLTSFTLKSDMRLAPTIRNRLSETKADNLVRLIKEQSVKEEGLYLKSLKSGANKPLSSGKTWPHSDKDDDDVILVEDELPSIDGAGEILTCEPALREKLRPKLLSFHENRRPPYWGTWRKTSKVVKPRRPFGQDEKQLDYEVDSDDEWEEEQEGESIDGSAAGSDDEQGPDEYEVDNEVFVPHGYLSDEEATMDEDDVLSLSPETQKARLKNLEDEFESEMKKPTEKLKPRLYGLLWENQDGGKPEKCVDALWNYFGKLAMIVVDDPTPLFQPTQEPEETEKKKVKKRKSPPGDGEQTGQKVEKKKKVKLQEKEAKPPNQDNKTKGQDTKKNQPGINMFLTKIKAT